MIICSSSDWGRWGNCNFFPQRFERRREELDVKEDDIRQITGDIIDSAMKIHKMFGPGMLESVYERILAIELKRCGYVVECQKAIGFRYEGEAFEDAFRLDLLVDREVVVELKSTGAMNPVFAKQLRTYLVLFGLEIGLVMIFGMALMKDGIVQVINSYNLNDSQGHLCDSAGNQFLNSR